MEYKIFHKIRQNIKIPYLLRIFFGVIFILIGIFASIIPVIPGFIFVTIGALFLIPAKKIKNIIKIRKGIIHLFKNLHCKTTIKRKFSDFFRHGKDIFKVKKIKIHKKFSLNKKYKFKNKKNNIKNLKFKFKSNHLI